jgi:hypothetical protein
LEPTGVGEVQEREGEWGALGPSVVAEPDDAVPEKVFIGKSVSSFPPLPAREERTSHF